MHSILHNRRSGSSIIIFTLLAIFAGYVVVHVLVAPRAPFLPAFTNPWAPSKAHPPAASYHNYTSAFAFDLALAANPDWMARIPDAVSLSSLSIPGTHDTLTHKLVDNVVFQCQNHDLQTQLRAGLRYFDIRGRLLYDPDPDPDPDADQDQDQDQDPVIGIYHGHVATGYNLQDVLQTVFAFLDEHPSEGVILRVKEEGKPLPVGGPNPSDESGSDEDDEDDWVSSMYNTTFEEAFNYYRHTNPLTAPGSARHLLTPWPPHPAANTRLVPTMGEMRGRVLVLYEFPTAGDGADDKAAYGIPWTSPHIALEDLWIILAPELLEAKWDAVRRNLEAAAASADDADVLFLSHLSASVGVTPIEAAAGPLLDRTNGTVIVGLNERTGKWLERGAVGGSGRRGSGSGAAGKTGVVMADFPGQRLVGDILRRNQWLMKGDEGA
ncbi:unnamed protein product [Discula destructiva]